MILSGDEWELQDTLQKIDKVNRHQYRNDDESDSNKNVTLKSFYFDELDTTSAILRLFIEQSTIIQELSLVNCVGTVDLIVVTAFTNLQELQSFTLELSSVHITTKGVTAWIRALALGLQVTKTLRHLTLTSKHQQHFPLSEEAAECLGAGLARGSSSTTGLHSLRLEAIRFQSPSCAASLGRGLSKQRGLKELHIRSCYAAGGHFLGDQEVGLLINSLCDGGRELVKLSLVESKCLDCSLSAVAAVLSDCRIEELNISTMHFEDDNDERKGINLSWLVASLAASTSLRSLDLRRSRFGDEAMAFLVGALSVNSSIEFVNLSNNDITSVGVSIFASRIQDMASLRKIDLRRNLFDSISSPYMQLGSALERNEMLDTINCDQSIESNRSFLLAHYYLDLNRAGRRFLLPGHRRAQKNEPPLPSAAWSMAIGRVAHFFHQNPNLSLKEEREASTIYTLLRKGVNVLIESGGGG